MLCATTRTYTAVFPRTCVVLRGEDDGLQALLERELPVVKTVIAANAHLGMGHSLAAGIAAISDWQHVFVALADMPFVRRDSLETLQSCMNKALARAPEDPVIIQPEYRGTPGHPVGFSQHFFTELKKLTGDRGARQVINSATKTQLTRIRLDDPGILQDLDQPP